VPTNKGIFVSGRRETNFNISLQNIGTEDISSAFDVDVKLAKSSSGGGKRFETTESISSISAGSTMDVEVAAGFNPSDSTTFSSADVTVDLGTSYYLVSSFDISDEIPDNDENFSEVMVLADTILSSVNMSYAVFDGQFAEGFGFEGGGVYIKPPHYPVDVVSLNYFFLTADNTPAGDFFARVWADNGVDGTFDMMHEEIVSSSNIIPNITDANGAITEENGMTQVFLNTPVTITEGGFYVGFEAVDATTSTYNLAENTDGTTPRSYQNYEILSGVFGEYRSNADADLMIGATVNAFATKVSVEEAIERLEVGEVYPNPTSNIASVKVDVSSASKVSYSVKNVIGQEIKDKNLGNVNTGQKVINFNVSDLETGIYFCTVTINGNSTTKKFTVK